MTQRKQQDNQDAEGAARPGPRPNDPVRRQYGAAALLSWLLLGSAGCGMVAGINDITYNDPPDSGQGGSDASLESDTGVSGTGGSSGDDGAAGGSDAADDAEAGECSNGPVAMLGTSCCTPAELACAGNAQKLVLFCDAKSSQWSALQSCSGSMLCDTRPGTSQGSCQEQVPLCVGRNPGDKTCDGTMSIECGPDLVTSSSTQCAFACLDGECVGGCEPETKQCSGTAPQTCDATGAWVDGAPCAFVCTGGGTCTGECLPDTKDCDGNTPKTCDAAGHWVEGAPCPNLCSAGECVESCTANEKKCSGLVPLDCVGGIWQSGAACTYVCTAGVCTGSCSPGSQQCDGSVPQTCDATGQWQSGTACYSVCDAGVCTGVCPPGTKSCDGSTPRACDSDGQWVTGASCTYVCSAGVCGGVCVPGSAQCNGLTPETCSAAGQWVPGTPCTFACSSGACTGVCTTGAKQCNSGVPQTCDANGVWQDGTLCSGSTPECVAGVCQPCTSNHADCDASGVNGCETHISTDPNHCGSCTNVCNSTHGTATCSSSTCGISCSTGWGNCDGLLTNGCELPVTDINHCGSCTTVCGSVNGSATCSSSTCLLSCNPGYFDCDGNPANGCESTSRCSCTSLAATCGAGGSSSCCTDASIIGGTFFRSYDGIDNTSKSYPATVSDFRIDTYEVTVGRFRKFVNGGFGTVAKPPAVGAGAHPAIPGSGWLATWNPRLSSSTSSFKDNLDCSGASTWTDSPGSNENKPINCITWYDAFAFCAWDGGRLPTEAEWNYVAAGGTEQRVYPWAVPSTSKTIDSTFAVYNGVAIALVGSKSTKGDARWGHVDMAGNLMEWVLDIYASYDTPCTNCAHLASYGNRTLRGGSNSSTAGDLGTADRFDDSASSRDREYGVRCVRMQ